MLSNVSGSVCECAHLPGFEKLVLTHLYDDRDRLLFYVLSVFMAGLLVPHNACELYPTSGENCHPYLPGNKTNSLSSPYVPTPCRDVANETLKRVIYDDLLWLDSSLL